jgi:hypothetical protein
MKNKAWLNIVTLRNAADRTSRLKRLGYERALLIVTPHPPRFAEYDIHAVLSLTPRLDTPSSA